MVNGYQATEVEGERTSISELFFHQFFSTARDRMPSISSLRCCKGILCTGLRGQSLAELHWTLVVKNSLFKLGTSSTQPSWLLPKGRHHHSAKSRVVEAALLQSGPMFWPQMDAPQIAQKSHVPFTPCIYLQFSSVCDSYIFLFNQ